LSINLEPSSELGQAFISQYNRRLHVAEHHPESMKMLFSEQSIEDYPVFLSILIIADLLRVAIGDAEMGNKK